MSVESEDPGPGAIDVRLERQLAGRILAIHRDAIPAIEQAAALRARSIAGQRKAARGSAASSPSLIQQRGATAVVPISGPIMPDSFLAWLYGGVTPDSIAAAVQDAGDDQRVSQIVLVVNSPGGVIDLVPETAAIIRGVATQKPVLAIARTMACSAGYWLPSQVGLMCSTPSGLVGSVGVYMMHSSYAGALEQAGIEISYIASDPRKVEGNAAEPLSDAARGVMQGEVDGIYRQFVGDVAAGRGISAARVRDTFGGGRVLSPRDALRVGMIDRVCTLESLLGELSSGGRRSTLGAQALTHAQRIAANEGAVAKADADFVAAAVHIAEFQVGIHSDAQRQAEADADFAAAAIRIFEHS